MIACSLPTNDFEEKIKWNGVMIWTNDMHDTALEAAIYTPM
jgi:hypothetical protein